MQSAGLRDGRQSTRCCVGRRRGAGQGLALLTNDDDDEGRGAGGRVPLGSGAEGTWWTKGADSLCTRRGKESATHQGPRSADSTRDWGRPGVTWVGCCVNPAVVSDAHVGQWLVEQRRGSCLRSTDATERWSGK